MTGPTVAHPTLLLGDISAGCVLYLPPFDSRYPDCMCTCCYPSTSVDEGAYSHPVVVLWIDLQGRTGRQGDVHFLLCASTIRDDPRKHYTPIGVNLIVSESEDVNDDGRARYWLENGKSLRKPTKIQVDHIFVLPFTRFRVFDDAKSGFDYRLDGGSYQRLLKRIGSPIRNVVSTSRLGAIAMTAPVSKKEPEDEQLLSDTAKSSAGLSAFRVKSSGATVHALQRP
ncbi:uncharacterized protein LY89DRAFT_786337 [Mollisia scopiformis]|uniref:Uncharacterized protein n=1 Tax=Mollisia scopiformis TaxID=149040 RepID=A0A194WW67_MOLSC|nr:uncharacterized protein LY89DRAFT_786337 [Mollisia scopiformis]KUJ12215.1 hypothetical protein LY89DRAFT_786337 [Mollisia scopiformis]